jgi:CBS domain-containing protein
MIDLVASFLSKYPPFSGLPGDLPGEAARRSSLKNLPQGESLGFGERRSSENGGRSVENGARLGEVCVVSQGRLDLYRESVKFASLLPGDLFGYGGFVQGADLPAHRAVAAVDSVLIVLPVSVFSVLAAEPGFAARLAAEADRLREALEAADRARQSGRADPFMRLTIKNVELKSPVSVPGDAPLAQAARSMIQAGASACLVGEAGAIRGILTERDVLGAVASKGVDPREVRAAEVMTPSIITIGQDEPLFAAFAMMVKHAIRRLVVVDGRGAPAGIIGERDLLAVRGENPVRLAGEIAEADSSEALRLAFAKLGSLALRGVAEGVGVDILGRLISEMHDQIVARAAEISARDLQRELGPHAVVVLGSQGRKEQFFATDQDNALVFGDDLNAKSLKALTLYSERIIQTLLTVGFPPCPSLVMADNPQWRRSLREWENHVGDLVLAATPEAVLTLSLLADLRHVAGDAALGEALRGIVYAKVKASPVILKYMAREALRFELPLGFFGNFVLEKAGEARGKVDLKKGGVFPVVQGVRTLALDHGLTATATLERLARLRELGAVSDGLHGRLSEAYAHLQTLRIGSQAEAIREGRTPDNCIDPACLGAAGRDRLKDAFRVVAEFQALLHGKYALSLMM